MCLYVSKKCVIPQFITALEQNTTLLLFISLYMVITVVIGWWSSRFVKNTADFVIAGRRMPVYGVASGLYWQRC